MSWRTVVISNRCKLDLKLGYMVIRGAETRRMFLDEISVVIIENPAVSMTGCLLNALTAKKIKVIFCDDKHNPDSELIPFHSSYDSSRKIRMQISWDDEIQEQVWMKIVYEKIRNQAMFLLEREKTDEYNLLMSYLGEIEPMDATNREGFAAKVYFNGIFGKDFTRTNQSPINAALNYGYSILLSMFNREIVSQGYLTQIGIFHSNVFNSYNLSSDLMEPFRILVDRKVADMDITEFGKDEKHELLSFLNQRVKIASTKQTVINAITVYCRSVFSALNSKDISALSFYSIEEKR